MSVNNTKVCKICNETKIVNDFEKNRNICKNCKRLLDKDSKNKRIQMDKDNPDLDRKCYICFTTKKDNVIPSQVEEHISKLRLFISKYYIDKYNEVEEYISDVFLPFLTKI